MSLLLDVDTVAEYARTALSAVDPAPLDAAAKLEATEVTDGNLNYAWAVREANGKAAVFVKQAPAFIKCLGEGYALHAERLLLESDVHQQYAAIAPDHVPRFFTCDAARFVMVTEFLEGYELMRSALRSGSFGARAADDVARFLSTTHAQTWARPGSAAAERWSSVHNEAMCGITAEYVFRKPLDAADATNRFSPELQSQVAVMRADPSLTHATDELCTIFLERKQCLVHGDLHTGSVMVPAGGADGPAKVIDAEFAHYGCAAFDVGSFLAHLIFAIIAHAHAPDTAATAASETPSWPPTEAPRSRLHAMVRSAWAAYAAGMRTAPADRSAPPLGSDEEVARLLSLSAGFAGCELTRRVVGAAHVDDLELLPAPRKLRAEKIALAVGAFLTTQAASRSEKKVLNVDALLVAVDTQVLDAKHAQQAFAIFEDM